MLRCHILVLLSLVDLGLGASHQSSLRGQDEREPVKPLSPATMEVAQDSQEEEDLTHHLQNFGTHMLRDLTSKVQGHLSSSEEGHLSSSQDIQQKNDLNKEDPAQYDAPLRKFGDKSSNETEVKQENDLPAVPSGIGDAIEERERHAIGKGSAAAPGAGGKEAPTIPGQNTDPVVSDAGKKRSAMENGKENESSSDWSKYGKEKWEESKESASGTWDKIKEWTGTGDSKKEEAKGAGEKIDGATAKSNPEHEMVPVPKETPAETPAPEQVPAVTEPPPPPETVAPEQKKKVDPPIESPIDTSDAGTVTMPPELGLPEDEAISDGSGRTKENSVAAGLPTGRGGARMAQPWIFSVMMVGILLCFCCGVCAFARHAKNSFALTENELRELLEKLKSNSMNDLMNEHAYGTPTPVPILRARHLVKKARDDQDDAKKEHRVAQYNAVRQAILDESYKMRIGKSKEELQMMDEEIRQKLRIEKEKIRAATIKDWAEGRLVDPVPSLPEAEAWLAKLEKRWQELQMQST